jgi:hypothetical protein
VLLTPPIKSLEEPEPILPRGGGEGELDLGSLRLLRASMGLLPALDDAAESLSPNPVSKLDEKDKGMGVRGLLTGD